MSSDQHASTTLSELEQQLLSRVLDAMIPPDPARGLPGAGEVGLAHHVQEVLATSPELAEVVSRGLAVASALGGVSSPKELIDAISASEPGMLPALVFHVYLAYYQEARVIEALGLPPRPPHPEGYEVEQGDLGLLDAVRARAPFHRAT